MTWGPKHSQAVHELKKKLMDATNVHIFDPEEPITKKTDASKHAMGALLEQNGYPIAFESKMGARDKFLPAYEIELLAIVFALTKWKSFIGSKLVTVETDHATLSRMLTQKQVTTRLGYWLDKLADFDVKEVYKPGKQNVVADAISRRPDLVGAIRHPGIDRTKAAIRAHFWWPKMDEDIEAFVKACTRCARNKACRQRSGRLLQPLPIPEVPWEEISLDLIVGLPTTRDGYDAILTIVCRLTKMAHFAPTTQTVNTKGIVQILVRVVRLQGVPRAIVSDRDTRFTSDIWKSLCKQLDIKKR
ncbi:retrotransposon ty3-gypsy subclass, partial [Cystoisospora suis]